MKKIYQYDGPRYSYAVYVSKGIMYISNEHGTRKADSDEIVEIEKLINDKGKGVV